MVVHEGGEPREPRRGAADLAVSSVMNANEAPRGDRMHLAGEGFQFRQRSGRRRVAAAQEHHHVGLANGLARPFRGFAAGEIGDQRRDVFELVQPSRDFGCVQRAAGQCRLQPREIDDLGTAGYERTPQSRLEIRRQRLEPGRYQRHRPGLGRCTKRRKAGGLAGKAPRKGCEQRLDDRRRLLRQRLVGGARQRQYAGVADRDHVGGARDVGEEADLADQFAGPKLGDRFRMIFPVHGERTVQHQEQGVRGRALLDQQLPAHQILAGHGTERLQPLFRTQRFEQREVFRHARLRECRARRVHGRLPVRCTLRC